MTEELEMHRRRVDMAPGVPLALDYEQKQAEEGDPLTKLLHLPSNYTGHYSNSLK